MEELFAMIGLFTLPLSVGFAIAWWNARKELRLRREIHLQLGVRPSADTRQLEAAVEAIALEVERLAEGQRFVAKVLSERSSVERSRERPGGSSGSPHVNTPH